MPQIINTNIASLTAQRNLNNAQSDNAQALNRLSSGLRINSAKDDAAGIAISTRFDSQIRGLNVATRNAGDGVSLAQTAEGGLDSMTNSLQRLRELAVQASNATNTDVDRAALNEEAQQLIDEIERVSEETNFNGVNLLNGDFSNAVFQVGANRGETIEVSIEQATIDTLGAGKTGGISSVSSSNSLTKGDLVINGVTIGGTSNGDDTASTDNAAASAIAKAAAINKVSDETGVTATVNANTLGGSVQTAAAVSGDIDINGVNISIDTTGEASTTRAAVTEAINAFSVQTGVRAVDTGSDGNGVTLIAEDGRNIELALNNGITAANSGLAAAGTYEGTFTLTSEEPFTISGGEGTGNGDIANSGLAAGTYSGGIAQVVSERVALTTSSSSLTGGAVTDTINAATTGIDAGDAVGVSYSIDGGTTTNLTSIVATDTIEDIAVQLNAVSGINAYTESNLTIDSVNGAATAIEFGTAATVAASFSAGASLDEIADAINNTDFSAQNIDVEATSDGTDIFVTVRNYSNAPLQVDSVAGNIDVNGTTITAGTPQFSAGHLEVQGENGQSVSVTLTDPNASAQLFAGTSATVEYNGVDTLDDGDLTINGTAISAANPADDTASAEFASDGSRILSSDKGASAISVAAAINKVSEETGVTATVEATTVIGGSAVTQTEANVFENGDQAGIYINGVNLGSVALQNDGTNTDFEKARADAVDIINSGAGITGVTAVDNGSSITLTAADGRNISVAIDDQSGEATSIGKVLGLDAAVNGIGEATFTNSPSDSAETTSSESLAYETTVGRISLSSADAIEIGAGDNGKSHVEALGFSVGVVGGSASGQFIKDVDISTVAGANKALEAVDNALRTINTQRAQLGAVQNRFEASISTNTLNAENLTSANSRIRDADFAAETAALSRSQVLQQAGISILAQANGLPQQVLSLLG